ncbi:MAG: acyl-CoA dehydrogenase, partial [Nannocystaceae bacterium]
MTVDQHFKSNLRDTFFNLFEVLDLAGTTLGKGPYEALDEETVRAIVNGYEQFCKLSFATSFAEADRVPLKLDDEGNVTLPPGLHSSLKAFYDGGWHLLDTPERLGGMGAPPSVSSAAFEYALASNSSAALYTFSTILTKVLDQLLTPEQHERFVTPLLERYWGGTMVLTEPDAGSDVGTSRTKARHIEDDVWEIEGVKRFITNGDYDVPENILHLVLARPEGARPGTKGLSCFIVPKFWVNKDGSMGERNGVYVTNIEKKMGLKGSATCELTFGERGPARGILVGNTHNGIRQMFHVIEHARMAVGLKSMATLSTAYLNALEYTKIRIQGADLKQAGNKDAPRVAIIRHPDVRRMLMTQKSFAEGMRALCLHTAWNQDQLVLAREAGNKDEAAVYDRRNDLLLPLVKGYCSHKVYEVLAMSLQCFGGSGYCKDYPIEQYIRDQKIDALYEGTTHIQALDLFFRKVAKDGGQTLRGLLGEAQSCAESLDEGTFGVEKAALGRALVDLQGIYMAMLGKVSESPYHVGLHGNKILYATAELMIGWLLIRQGPIARQALDEIEAGKRKAFAGDVDFYTGKLAAIRFYCQSVLPGLTGTRKLVEASTLDLMDVPES